MEAYGIFLRIENTEISGLCHRSEVSGVFFMVFKLNSVMQLSDNKTHDVSKALKGFREGDQVKAVITEIDQEKRRLNFSIKPSRFSDEFGMPGAADEGDTEEEDEEDVREDESGGENEEEDQGKGSSEAGEGEGEVSLNDLLEADDSDDGVDGGQDGDSSDDEDVQVSCLALHRRFSSDTPQISWSSPRARQLDQSRDRLPQMEQIPFLRSPLPVPSLSQEASIGRQMMTSPTQNLLLHRCRWKWKRRPL